MSDQHELFPRQPQELHENVFDIRTGRRLVSSPEPLSDAEHDDELAQVREDFGWVKLRLDDAVKNGAVALGAFIVFEDGSIGHLSTSGLKNKVLQGLAGCEMLKGDINSWIER
jgi:hypothetical protein